MDGAEIVGLGQICARSGGTGDSSTLLGREDEHAAKHGSDAVDVLSLRGGIVIKTYPKELVPSAEEGDAWAVVVSSHVDLVNNGDHDGRILPGCYRVHDAAGEDREEAEKENPEADFAADLLGPLCALLLVDRGFSCCHLLYNNILATYLSELIWLAVPRSNSASTMNCSEWRTPLLTNY